MVDTAQYKKEAPWTVCFSNAGVNNPGASLATPT